jgi:hypothetical protein
MSFHFDASCARIVSVHTMPARATIRRRSIGVSTHACPASIEAQVLDYKQPAVTNRITDISMDGCTLQATGFSKGSFIELVLKPTVEEEAIRVETAMVCSVRPSSIGIRFLEIPPDHYRRLAQIVLGLLVGQGLDPTLNA